ncbi:MAG: DUF4147 domain-containing protein [Candidatus Paceibacterota bacterium]
MSRIISNFDSLATNQLRIDALSIIEEGYRAIDTVSAMTSKITLEDGTLSIQGHPYELSQYERVVIIGFGKASCKAAKELERILGDFLTEGIVIDKHATKCDVVEVFEGTHPLPSPHNVEVSQKIADLAESLTEKDLAIVIVSGGGSALLCLPLSECEQGALLYSELLKAGGNIKDLNTLRKHVSSIKGGGLAKMLHPATVVSLIFSDVPGDHFKDVASGPTYLDTTTISDAENLLVKHNVNEHFIFNETPKDEQVFTKVRNIPFISNKEALWKMEAEGKRRGYEVIILGDEVYDSPDVFLKNAESLLKPKTMVIAGGELSIALSKSGGVGGRNLYIANQALDIIGENDMFIAFASDGIDNKSVAAGAIADADTKKKLQEKNIDSKAYHEENKDSELFMETGDAIITGDTGSNVSDLYLMIRN